MPRHFSVYVFIKKFPHLRMPNFFLINLNQKLFFFPRVHDRDVVILSFFHRLSLIPNISQAVLARQMEPLMCCWVAREIQYV